MLLDPSVAVNTMFVVPTPTTVPAAGTCVTKTPQQNLNQQSPRLPHDMQQEREDSNQINREDPYLLAFNILEEFDMIRLPENVDYSRLDLDTLAMYKNDTLAAQRNEALDFVRNQVAHDPLMLQLFDYGYYGKNFTDLPKMQNILKEEFDFATYNISSERAQRAIVKLYHTDGLDPSDNRDRKIIENVPAQIERLAENLTLRREAEIAKAHFVQIAQHKASLEEQKTLALMQQQEQADLQLQQDLNNWNHVFIDSLNKRKWSEGKKATVRREASFVTLENGQEMPLWQYKQEIIFNNPVLFQVFLDFISKFNLETSTFGEANTEEIPQSTLNKIVQRLQNKSNMSRTTMGNVDPQQKGNVKQPRVTDVNRNWFM